LIYCHIQITGRKKLDPSLFSLNEEPIDADIEFLLEVHMNKVEIEEGEPLFVAEGDLEFDDAGMDDADMDATMLALQEILQSKSKFRFGIPDTDGEAPEEELEEALEEGEILKMLISGQKRGRSPR
jgi:hypothetical protein